MVNFFSVIFFSLLVLNFFGCSTLKKITHPVAQINNNVAVFPLSPYSGLKAQITLAEFEIKAAKVTSEIGSGLREMLTIALINSNRFSVVERQSLSSLAQEDKLAVLDAAQQGDGESQKNKIKPAELMIIAAVTEFEPQSSGGSAGLGGGGGVGSGALGGLLGVNLNKAHIALDIRIVDTLTSEVLVATSIQGQALDVSGAVMGGIFGSYELGSGLAAYSNTPMEKAIRTCIIEVVRYISQSTPPAYFKY